jgi:hypothetical protein
MKSGTDLAGNVGATTITLGMRIDRGNRRDVAHEIEMELVVERGVDRVRRRHQQNGVPVGCRIHHRLGADIGCTAWSVLDDEGLAEPLR